MSGTAPRNPMRIVRLILLGLVLAVLVFAVVHAWPPSSVTIETGPVGGSYYDTALKYREALRKRGIDVRIKPNPQSLDIIADVNRGDSGVDIGFSAQAVRGDDYREIASAGAIELQPLFIFYNDALGEIASLTTMRGKRLVLPPEQSATSDAALRILRLFDVTPTNTRFSFLPFDAGVAALKAGKFDVGMFMLDPANAAIASLVNDDNFRLLSINDGPAIARRLPFLRVVNLPRGGYDPENNVPPDDVQLLAATINVIVRRSIPPAVLYPLLDAMNDAHRGATLVNGPGEFPSVARSDLAIHPLALEYAKTGAPWVYRNLWLPVASLIDHYLIVVISIFLVTEIYKSWRYLNDLSNAVVENICLHLLTGIERRSGTRPVGHFHLRLVRIAERVLFRSSKRARSQELIGRIRRIADPGD